MSTQKTSVSRARPESSTDLPQIEWVPIASLLPNPRNARTHSNKQLRKIAASLRQFGFLNPIIVDDDGVVLAGHGRLAAARLEGWAQVPVIQVGHLSAAQKRAYVIADNKIAEQAGWDRELLAIELNELIELLPGEGMEIGLTGFETGEIDLLLADMSAPGPDSENVVPRLPKTAVARRGDLWQMGKHRVMCGDAQEDKDFAQLMGGALAAASICDPPYNISVKSIGGRGQVKHEEFAFASGEMSPAQYLEFLIQTLGHAARASIEGAVHYVFIDWRQISVLIKTGRKVFGEMLNLVVWIKTNAGQGSLYRSQHELIGVFRVGASQHRNNVQLGRFGRNRSNVWTYAGVNSFGKGRKEALASHPTVKPVALVADALLDCTARGEIVLDPFLGSGTTVIAAEKVGRVAYGLEYEPRYVDVAILRWQRMTKLEATLAGDGRSFEEIAIARAMPPQAAESLAGSAAARPLDCDDPTTEAGNG